MIMLKKIIKIHKFLLEFSGGAAAPLDESPLLQLAQTFATVSVTYLNRINLSTSTTVIWCFKMYLSIQWKSNSCERST